MAELDFALLAEFARVDPTGLLTVVGGGFDRVQASGPGLVQQVYVVFRTHLGEAERSATFQVRVSPPGDEPTEVAVSGVQAANLDTEPVSGRMGVVSVVGLGIPIIAEGRYVVHVSVAKTSTRELPFVVYFASTSAN